MKNILKVTLLAFFVSLSSLAFGQDNEVDLDALVSAIEENPESAASLVEEAVRSSLGQITEITDRLMADFPELTEEIVLGAIAGMPEPLSAEDLDQLLTHVTLYRPGLAPEIVIGARRATDDMEDTITGAVRGALQAAINNGGLGVIGRTSGSSKPGDDFDPTAFLNIISPSQNQ